MLSVMQKRTLSNVRFWHLADIDMHGNASICGEKGGPKRAAFAPSMAQ
jgi:hypothetical protein